MKDTSTANDFHARIQQLEEEVKELGAIYQASNVGFITLSMEGKILRVNPVLAKMLGYTVDELLSESFEKFMFPEDIEPTKNELASIVQEEQTGRKFENKMPTKSGEIIWLSWSASVNNQKISAFATDVTSKKEANNFLRLLSNSVENSVDAISIFEIWFDDGEYYEQISYINNAFFHLTGYSMGDLKKHDFYKKMYYRSEEDYDNLQALKGLQKNALKGINENLDLYNYRKDGTKIWLNISMTAIKSPTNSRTFVFATRRDITDIIKYQESLTVKNEILSAVSAITKIGGWELNLENNDVFWTNETYTIHELDNNVPITFQLSTSFMLEEYKENARVALGRAVMNKSNFKYEIKIRTARGNIRDVYVSAKIILNRENKASKVIGIIQDITELKKEKQYKAMLESVAIHTSDGISITNANPNDPKIFYVNKAFIKMTGYTEAELIGQNPKKNRGEDTSQEALKLIRDKLQTFEPVKTELLSYTKEGTPYWTMLEIFPLYDEQGNPQSFVGLQRDITKEKMNRELLEQEVKERTEELNTLNNKLTQFARVVSHDLKAPIRLISSFLELLKHTSADQLNERALGYLEHAEKGTMEAMNLLEAILNYTKVRNSEIVLTEIDMNGLIQNLKKFYFKKILEESNGQVKVEKLPMIKASKYQISQVFQNLISNALKFSRPDTTPTINIRYSENKEYHHFYIRDNGIGMDSKYIGKIFTPFKRLHNSSEYEGHGIGLSICKEIAEAHGGTIEVVSELGKGTEFTISIKKELDLLVSKSIN